MQVVMMQPIWKFVCRAVESVQMLKSPFSVMFHDVYKTVCINLNTQADTHTFVDFRFLDTRWTTS